MARNNNLLFWRKALLFSFLLAVSTAWVVFDSLFAPFGREAVSVEIPDLHGVAPEEIDLPAWLAVKVEYRYNKEAPAGRVFSQSPAAGSRRKLTEKRPTCELVLTVSLGEETLTLPKVLGLDHRSVTADLRGMGLSVVTESVASPYPEGSVIDVSPREGSLLPVGGRVTLTVSAGTPSESVTVPELCGLSRSEALVQLWLSRLAVDRVIEVDSPGEAGEVFKQSHKAGSLVAAGTRVTIYVTREDK